MSANTHFTTTFISYGLRQLVFFLLPLLIGRIFTAHPLGLQNKINFYTPLLLDQRFSHSLLADEVNRFGITQSLIYTSNLSLWGSVSSSLIVTDLL